MEKLTNALLLRITGNRVHLRKSHPCKTGCTGKISRQAQCSHTTAIALQWQLLGKQVFRLFWRKSPVIIQQKHLLVKRWVICHNARRVFVNFQPILHGFHRDSLISIRDDPVQGSRRHIFRKRCSGNVDLSQQFPYFLHIGTLSQHPRNKFKGGNIFFSLCHFREIRISDKIQSCHPNAFFVDRIIIQRIVCCNMRHSYDRIMVCHIPHMPEMKRIIARCHCNLLSI